MNFEEREAVYGQEEYYWGREPSSLAKTVTEYLPEEPAGKRLVDLGAGEGRDAVFFAEYGFDVHAVDISPAGLEKANRLAAENGVSVTTIQADLNDFELTDPMDVVFSSGALQFIHPEVRPRQFEHFKTMTKPGGLHAMFAFVDHPDVPQAPDHTEDQYLFERDELQRYYAGWETLVSEEIIFEDDSGGVPHEHAARIHVSCAPEG